MSKPPAVLSRASSLERIPTYTPAAEQAIDRSVPDSVPAGESEEQKFFDDHLKPAYLKEIEFKVNEFVTIQEKKGRKVVLVTVS